jgi:hypothetical protein
VGVKTIGFAVNDNDREQLDELVAYFSGGNRSAYLRETLKVMQSIMIAEKLRELQAYGHQHSAELGLAGEDATAVTRRILKGRAE